MIGVINRNAIHHNKVLVRCTTPYVESAGKIVESLHTGEHLHRSEKVWFHKSWGCFQGPHIQCYAAWFHQLAHFLCFTKHINGFSLQNRPFQPEVQTKFLTSLNVYLFCLHPVTNDGGHHLLCSC